MYLDGFVLEEECTILPFVMQTKTLNHLLNNLEPNDLYSAVLWNTVKVEIVKKIIK